MTGAASRVAHAVAIFVGLATLLAVGQPLFANDSWIHLALGEAFAAEGPWLSSDPHLFAAPGPPAPSSWLGSVAIYQTYEWVGFTGLRIAAVVFVAGLLVATWHLFRRAQASRAGASAGVVLFILLATYRIVQLRPELFSIAATLVLAYAVLQGDDRSGWRFWGLAGLLSALWANVHAGFLLGPILLLGVACSLLADCGFRHWAERGIAQSNAAQHPAFDSAAVGKHKARLDRGLRIAVAGGVSLAASLLNPLGIGAHLAYFQAGDGTLPLASVVDEWAPTHLFAWPVANLPPTPLVWGLCWAAVGLLAVASIVYAAERIRALPDRATGIDPALLAMAFAGLLASLWASRFLWMLVFVFALVPSLLGVGEKRRHAAGAEDSAHPSGASGKWAWAGVALGLVIVSLHFRIGDWPLVTRSIGPSSAGYRLPYSPAKYFGHAMWFLEDVDLEGRIYNDYPLGGFMSFWVGQRLQMASSGTMNVERGAMEDHLAIAGRRGLEGADFDHLLERQAFDLFLGTGLPVAGIPGKPIASTIRHLERSPSWIPIFRNLRSTLYMRRGDRNRGNLERVVRFYEAAAVPFDPATGFDVERVILEAPEWAIAHGIVPRDFDALVRSLRKASTRRVFTPRSHLLADLYATLGLYERSLALDRSILIHEGRNERALQRVLWCEVQRGDYAAAIEAAERLENPFGRRAGGERPKGSLRQALNQQVGAPAAQRKTFEATIPLLSFAAAREVQSGVVSAEARRRRRAD